MTDGSELYLELKDNPAVTGVTILKRNMVVFNFKNIVMLRISKYSKRLKDGFWKINIGSDENMWAICSMNTAKKHLLNSLDSSNSDDFNIGILLLLPQMIEQGDSGERR